jgi:hypothetical protein
MHSNALGCHRCIINDEQYHCFLVEQHPLIPMGALRPVPLTPVPFIPPAVALPRPVVLIALAVGAGLDPAPGGVTPVVGAGDDVRGAVLKMIAFPGVGLTPRVLATAFRLRMVPPGTCCRDRSAPDCVKGRAQAPASSSAIVCTSC